MDDGRQTADAAEALMDDRIDRDRTRGAVMRGLFGRKIEPTRIDRFEVAGTVGQGAMGRVYAARDPKLQRQVAIKVVREAGDGADAAARRDNLLAEARAMARLQHPNVVTVFEAGRTDDDVYLAMELVGGATLRRWAARDEVSDAQRLGAVVDMARGLAAAHDIELIHRDLKPDNVVVDEGGRARITDFGLALTQDETTSGTDETAGTPAYMAPELRRGESATALSDQYAFCVTAWEVLTGARPGDDGDASTHPLPAWLRPILERGMHDEPAARWPSMHALTARLQRGPARWWRRLALVGGTATVVGALAWWSNPNASLDPCQTAELPIAAYTSAAAIDAVGQAVRATGLAFAPGVAEQAWAELSQYGATWGDAATGLCRGQVPDPVVAERGPACLDDALSVAGAVVGQLRSADADLVPRAHEVLGLLPSIDRCLDPAHLRDRGVGSGDLERDARARALRRRLDRLRARRTAGREQGMADVARAIVRDADAIGEPRLRVEAQLMLADVIERGGDYAQSQRLAEEAYFLAESSGADFEAAFAATKVAGIALRREHSDDALRWVAQARQAMTRAPSFGRFAGRITRFEALAHMDAGNLDAAAAAAALAYEQAQEGFGVEAEETAHALSLLGGIEFRRGNIDAAIAKTRAAFETIKTHVGPGHPTRAEYLNNLGVMSRRAGDLAAARDYLERALAIKQTQYDGPSPALAPTFNGLGLLAFRQGDFEGAREHFAAALTHRRGSPTPDALAITRILDNVAMLELAADDPARALELTGEALAGHDSRGSSDRERAITRLYRATALRRLDRFEASLALDRETLAAEADDESTRPIALVAATGIAAAQLGLGRPEAALEAIATARAHEHDDEAELYAELDVVEARVLHALGRDPARVRALVEGALETLRGGPTRAVDVREAETFLASLPSE